MWWFFSQAEDGIRDDKVTGVQTCALPIFAKSCSIALTMSARWRKSAWSARSSTTSRSWHRRTPPRSEERRVGRGRITAGTLDEVATTLLDREDRVCSPRG